MNEKKTFTFDGVSSERFGLWISGAGTYDTPERDVELVSVPGRNGDLEFFNGRYHNVLVNYRASGIVTDFKAKIADFTSWAMSKTGYKRLEDDYHTDYFRLARVVSPIELYVAQNIRAGKLDISFDAKPQKFLKTGETAETFTANGTIRNPTLYNAKPLIRIYGTGTLKIGTYQIQLTNNGTYTDVDCDIMNAYNASENLNRYLKVTNNKFPEILPGNNSVKLTGITKVEITPRWWTL